MKPAGPPATSAPVDAFAGTLASDATQASVTLGSSTRSPGAARPAAPGLDLPVLSPGRYRVGGEKGRGGIGRVTEAQDLHLDRPVAIKELLADPGELATVRFVREALITARLQHPGVVPVYDAGRWPSGEPFYAMKLISGRSLDEAIGERHTLEARLGLLPHVLAVAETIAYAHGQGVVHRDLKPANVVVGAYGETVVIDWGLAKDRALADDLAPGAADSLYQITHADLTRLGTIVGTPAYMPPEQARGEAVDERADVYAVGAILYRVLAGVAPYQGRAEEVLGEVLEGPPVALVEREPGVPRDLAAIVDKAMAREPGARYPSAKELAGDLARFLDGQLVGAREYSRWALVVRFVRRHLFFVGGVLLLALVIAASTLRVVRERDTARASAAALVLTQARALVDRDPTAAIAWLERYPGYGHAWNEVQTLAASAASAGVARHVWRVPDAEVVAASFSPDGRRVATASMVGIELWDAASGRRDARIAPLRAHCQAFTPDGRFLLVGSDVGEIVVIDVQGGREVARRAAHQRWINQFVFLPDGRILSAGVDGAMRLFALGGDGSIGPFERDLRGHEGIIDEVMVDAQGRVWSSGQDGTVRRWDVGTGAGEIVLTTPAPRPYAPAALSRDGRVLLTVDGERVLWWQDGVTRELGREHLRVRAVALSSDGRTGITAGEDGSVSWWNASGLVRSEAGHDRPIVELALAADDTTLASGDMDGTIRVWQGQGVRVLRGHQRAIEMLAFSPDGHTLLSASDDGSARAWPLTAGGRFTRLSARPLFRLAFSEDGRRVATSSKDGGVRVLDLVSGAVTAVAHHELAAFDLALVPHRDQVLSGSWKGTVALAPVDGRAPAALWKHGGQLWSVDASPDGTSGLSAGEDGDVRLWQLATGTSRVLVEHPGGANDAVFSPDGRTVASSGADRLVRVTEVETGASFALAGHTDTIPVLRFAADGRTLYSGSFDGTVRAWDLASRRGRVLARHAAAVRTIALAPDGRHLASGGEDALIRLVDLRGGEVRVLRGHEHQVRQLAFSPDGRCLASAGWDGTVRLWRLDDGRVAVLRGHIGQVVHAVVFSPDGATLASTGDDGRLGLWRVAEQAFAPAEHAALAAWLRAATTASVGPDAPLATAP